MKIHMVIAIYATKAYDKTQCSFLIKSLSKLGTKGDFLILIKSISENPADNIILNSERLNDFYL